MNARELTISIVNLIDTFHKVKSESIYSLLKGTGYFELHHQVNEAIILDSLLANPECIQQWLAWSSDKRVDSGWYFKQRDDGKFEVGHQGQGDSGVAEYTDIAKACAAFIKQEIEMIRKA
jgi:hypothetical protein